MNQKIKNKIFSQMRIIPIDKQKSICYYVGVNKSDS